MILKLLKSFYLETSFSLFYYVGVAFGCNVWCNLYIKYGILEILICKGETMLTITLAIVGLINGILTATLLSLKIIEKWLQIDDSYSLFCTIDECLKKIDDIIFIV